MPPPAERGRPYVAGLDGVRAVAVLTVIAYHLGLPAARGGMLGVGVFFTLSGYLITDLLLGHWRQHGRLGLGEFWLRRARRLLPALFVMLAVVSVGTALFDAAQLADTRRQVIAALGYFNNWSTIAAHGSYFARFAPRFSLPLSRRVHPAVGRDGGGARLGGQPAEQAGPRAGVGSAALGRRPVLRHLPLAVADHRPREPGVESGRLGEGDARGRRHLCRGRPVVALCRG